MLSNIELIYISIWKSFPNNLLDLGHFHDKFLGLARLNIWIYNEI